MPFVPSYYHSQGEAGLQVVSPFSPCASPLPWLGDSSLQYSLPACFRTLFLSMSPALSLSKRHTQIQNIACTRVAYIPHTWNNNYTIHIYIKISFTYY